MESKVELRKRVLKMLRGPRGSDFLRCFEDMSLRDASKICNINFTAIRMIKRKRAGARWDFHELRAGRLPSNKWKEIKEFREEMILDTDFKDFMGILLQAAEHGGLIRKICGPKTTDVNQKFAAFEEGVRERGEGSQKNQTERQIYHWTPVDPPAHLMAAAHDRRFWTVFTSLNQQQTYLARNKQVQLARMTALTQQAMEIVRSLPPPVHITQILHPPPPVVQQVLLPPKSMPAIVSRPPNPAPNPAPAIVSRPPNPAPAIEAPLQNPAPAIETPLPNPAPEPRPKEYVDTGAQATPGGIETATLDETLPLRTATPRDINRPPLQLLYHEPYPKGRASKAVQLRSWMLLADLVFSNIPKTLTTQEMKQYLSRYYHAMSTPMWIYSDLDDFLSTRWCLAQYGMESVLMPDGGLDALLELEPITEWGWLLTMGLAR